jgi:hypothetical protein
MHPMRGRLVTPANVLAAIPNDLLRRRTGPDQQAHAANLARWFLDRGHRPSLLEIEQERARRTSQ